MSNYFHKYSQMSKCWFYTQKAILLNNNPGCLSRSSQSILYALLPLRVIFHFYIPPHWRLGLILYDPDTSSDACLFFSHHHHAILWPAGCPTIPLNSDTLPTDSVWSQRLRAQFHETALTFRYQLQDQLQARVSKGDDAWLFLKIDRNPNITVPNRKGRLVGHLCFWPIDYRSINYRSKDPLLGFH